MSLLSEKSATVGNFKLLTSERQYTDVLNGGGIGDLSSGDNGYTLLYNKVNNLWTPQPVTIGTNVFVSPDSSNNPFYLPFVNATNGSVPLKANTSLSYNPGLQTLTVPFTDTIASNAILSEDADEVGIQDDTSTNALMYPTFVASNGGYNNVRVDSTALTYNPFTNVLSCTSLNVTNINGQLYPFSTGNTLTVDAVYGDDTTAGTGLNRYSFPFKTISAALLKAVAGENVIVNAGVYNETLVIPDNVSLTGTGTQCVVIQKLNVTADTTLITVGSNCRLENFTARLNCTGNYTLVGIRFPSGTSTSTKMRNSVWTVENKAAAPTTDVIGVLSDGTSDLGYTAVNAIQRTSINVIGNSVYSAGPPVTGRVRGILISGANYFSVRDMVVWARGSGTNIIGAETSAENANLSLKTSTVGGFSDNPAPGVVYADINRYFTTTPTTKSSTILIGFTDLQNSRANGNPSPSTTGNSFTVVTESSSTTFGCYGNLQQTTYYLVPGTNNVNQLSNSDHFNVIIPQSSIMFVCYLTFSKPLPVGSSSLTFQIWKHTPPTKLYELVLLPPATTVFDQNRSIDFVQGEVYYTTLLVGAGTSPPNNASFSAVLGFY